MTLVLGLQSLLGGLTGLLQGFGFGAGYGSGVRFGYQDLYPALKSVVKGTHGSFFGSGLKGGLGLDLPEVFADTNTKNNVQALNVDTSGLGLSTYSQEHLNHQGEFTSSELYRMRQESGLF